MTSRRTKLVCTLGPTSSSEARLRELVEAGMDVARFNFSHGTHEAHLATLTLLRRVAADAGRSVAALADLQGPKIRVGRFASGPITLEPGTRFTITTRDVPGSATEVSTTYEGLPADVVPGERLLLADGLLELRAVTVSNTDVVCEVVVGGPLSNNKGINLPQTRVSAPSLTEKDRRDLDFALEHGFDAVALSFVRQPEDVLDARRIIHRAGKCVPVIAKIERAEAVEVIEDVIAVSDGIMIARGDLGVELPPENVPVIQKHILGRCNELGVPVITATQMLESMIEHPRPTRAEASDVANAIFDGTDAVMLSGETASGKYPVESVRMMDRIARFAEASRLDNIPNRYELDPFACVEDAVAQATTRTADLLGVDVVAVYTVSGSTAMRVAKYRPEAAIVALVASEQSARRLAFHWGVQPIVVPVVESVEALFPLLENTLAERGLAVRGDTVVVTAGVPLARPGTTNTIKVHRIEGGPAAASACPVVQGPVTLDQETCIDCGLCIRLCPESIFTSCDEGGVTIDGEQADRCHRDGLCVGRCPVGAIRIGRNTDEGTD